MKILFVCRGNVGRSQMAEGIFNSLTKTHTSTSVGTKVFNKDGESKHGQKLKDLNGAAKIVASMKEIGIDVSEYERTQLSPEHIENVDIIINMAEEDTIPKFLKDNPKVVTWNVQDPKDMTLEQTNIIRDQIVELVKNFISTLK